MKLIYSDKLREDVLDLPNCSNGFSDTYDKACILDLIDEQPTVDAVPVVRCKDCVWYEIAELRMDGEPDRRYKPSVCTLWRQYMSETDYCSYGNRWQDGKAHQQ